MTRFIRYWMTALTLSWALGVLPAVAQEAPATQPAVPAPPPIKLVVPATPMPLPDIMPEGTLLYLGWPGIDALSETCTETAMAKMLKGDEFVRFRTEWCEKVMPAIKEKAAEEFADSEEEMFKAAEALLVHCWHYPVAIGLVQIGMGQFGPQVDVAIVIRAGKDAGQVIEKYEELLAQAQLPMPIVDAPLGEVTFKELPLMGPTMSVRWGVLGDDALVTIGNGVLQHLAAGSESTSLGKSERFQAAMKIVEGDPGMPTVFVDVKGLVQTLQTFQPMLAGFEVPVLGEQGGVQKMLDSIGMGSVQSLTMVMGPEANGFKSSMLIHAPGMAGEQDTSSKRRPITNADLTVVPKEVKWATVSNFDLLGTYQLIMNAIATLVPDAHEEITGWIAELEEGADIKVAEDLLGAFGDKWAIFDAPSHSGLWFTGIVLVGDFKAGHKLHETMQKIVDYINQEADGDVRIEVASETHRGQKIHFLNFIGVPIPFAPAWVEYESKCVVALFPQLARMTLDRLIDRSESILANPDFVRGRQLMPSEQYSVSYVDSKLGVRQLYGLALPIGQAIMAMAQDEGLTANISMLPSVSAWTDHLYGHVSAKTVTEDGLLYVSHGPLPIAIPAIGEAGFMAPVMASIMLPSLARARELSKRSVSAANLKGIGTAMYVYANENDQKFPPDFQTLVDMNVIPPQTLRSPLEESDDEVSYIYIAGQTADMDQRNIVAYEKPENYDGEGTNVLFADSHVEYMNMSAFERALEETNERLGRTETSDKPAKGQVVPPQQP